MFNFSLAQAQCHLGFATILHINDSVGLYGLWAFGYKLLIYRIIS